MPPQTRNENALRKILLVFNPRAAHGRARKLLPEIRKHFEEHQLAVEVRFTEYRSHGTEIVANADFAQFDGVVAAGGDGTVFEMINGYFRNQSPKRIPIGVVPIGTGNAFARDLDLQSDDWQKAIDFIGRNKPVKIDVARFETEGKEHYFLNIIGVGFVTDVMATSVKLKFLGNLAYILSVFYQLLFLKTHTFTVTVDGKADRVEAIMIEIANTRYTGRDFLMAPQAKFDDGLLDVLVLGKASRLRLLRLFPSLFSGKHLSAPEVETFQTPKIGVQTEHSRLLGPDGELFGSTPLQVECLPQAVEIFA